MKNNVNKFFLQSFLKNRKVIGSIRPSSGSLTKKMLKDIDFKKAKVIVEFGPGTGVFTRAIVKKISPSTKLYVFELYQPFYNELKEEFKDQANVFIFNEKAQDVRFHLESNSADYIISSLPLTNINKFTTVRILETAKNVLKPGGTFIQYQYSQTAKRLLEKIFGKVKTEFTLNNIPPAFVYICNKT